MKYTFLFSAVLVVMSFGPLNAQDSLQLKSFIGRKFEYDFYGATDVEWTRSPSHYVVLFTFNNDVWLAFYNLHGELLASGRRLKDIRALPLHVQLGVAGAKRQFERKFGTVATSFAIETVARDSVKSGVPTEDSHAALMICSAYNGEERIETRTLPVATAMRIPSLLASSN